MREASSGALNSPRPLTDMLGPDGLRQVAELFLPGLGVTGRHVPGAKTAWGKRFGWFDTTAIARVLAGNGTETPDVLALRFGPETRYGLLDLDAGSPYKTLEVYANIAASAADRGLRVSLCRSSDSGGWHVYLWAAERVPTADMSMALFVIARGAGIEAFHDGVCEVYPDPGRPNKAVRLPGQPGFAWLSAKTGVPVYEYATTDVAGRFERLVQWVNESAVQAADLRAVRNTFVHGQLAARPPMGRPPKLRPLPVIGDNLPDPASLQLQPALVYKYNKNAALRGKPSFEVAAATRFAEGASLYASGLQRRGARNESLLRVSFFLFFVGFTDARVRETLLVRWMQERHNDLSSQWADPATQSGVLEEIHRLATWRPTTLRDAVRARANQRRSDRAARLLADATAALTARGEKATQRKISAITGMSSATIAKHASGTEP